jgi:hypothetical protein
MTAGPGMSPFGDPATIMPAPGAEPPLLEPEPMEYEDDDAADDVIDLGQGITPRRVEQALVQWCNAGLEHAKAASQEEKRQRGVFLRMKAGAPMDEEADDLLADLGFAPTLLPHFSDILRALMMREAMIANDDMDWFFLHSSWAGVEEHMRGITKLLHHKYKIMKPDGAVNYIDQKDRQCQDLIDLGDCWQVVTHEMADGEDGDADFDGGITNRLDPMNIWPWDPYVETANLTNFSVFSRLTDEDLENGEFYNKRKVFKEETMGTCSSVDPEAESGEDSTKEGELGEAYLRHIHFVRWPIRGLRKYLGLASDHEIDWATYFMWAAQKRGFDPSRIGPDTWWEIQTVGDTKIGCRPWPHVLPRKSGPLQCHRFNRVSGRLWGQGIYHRASWDERLYGFFQRCMIYLAAFNARPPVGVNKNVIDRKWWQLNGEKLALQPDMLVELSVAPGERDPQPFYPLTMNADAIAMLDEQQTKLEQRARAKTGVLTPVEGQAASKTATQDANNLQQGLMLVGMHTMSWVDCFFADEVLRMYLVQQQVMQEMGFNEILPASAEEGLLGKLVIAPEMMVSEAYFEIRMRATAGGVASQQLRMEALEKWMQMAAGMGMLASYPALEEYGNQLKVANTDKMMLMISPELQQMMMINPVLLGGQSGGELSQRNAAGSAARQPQPPGMKPQGMLGAPMAGGAPQPPGMGQ